MLIDTYKNAQLYAVYDAVDKLLQQQQKQLFDNSNSQQRHDNSMTKVTA
tara:strand:+ start:362 stop:508 length:147 start_codon:yes stop_codon:yes gene_type:complete